MELTSEQAEKLRAIAYKAAMKITRHDPWAADELAQNAIIRLLEVNSVVAEAALPSYTRRIVTNLYIDRFNKILKRGGPSLRVEFFTEFENLLSRPELMPSPSNLMIRHEDRAADRARYQAAVASLTDKERMMLYLAYGVEMSTAEIAEYMDYKSGKVVATKLGQIKAKLSGVEPPPSESHD